MDDDEIERLLRGYVLPDVEDDGEDDLLPPEWDAESWTDFDGGGWDEMGHRRNRGRTREDE